MPVATSPYLNRKEAAAYLGVQEQTLAAWANRGRPALPFIKVGRLAKYRLADLEEFCRRRTVGGFDDQA